MANLRLETNPANQARNATEEKGNIILFSFPPLPDKEENYRQGYSPNAAQKEYNDPNWVVAALEGFERAVRFPTTSWSAIVNARNPISEISGEALGRLCKSYWYPVFAFIRRKGLDSEQARDCTQDFFTALLE